MEMGTMIASLFFCINICIAERFVWQAGQEIDTGGLSRDSFPKGFVFGTSTSAFQVEGAAKSDGRGPSIWDTFIKPGVIPNNATADVSVDEYHRYRTDVELMVKMNMDAYRFSISWSRIFPKGAGRINYKGVQYYNNLINYLLKRGNCGSFYHCDRQKCGSAGIFLFCNFWCFVVFMLLAICVLLQFPPYIYRRKSQQFAPFLLGQSFQAEFHNKFGRNFRGSTVPRVQWHSSTVELYP